MSSWIGKRILCISGKVSHSSSPSSSLPSNAILMSTKKSSETSSCRMKLVRQSSWTKLFVIIVRYFTRNILLENYIVRIITKRAKWEARRIIYKLLRNQNKSEWSYASYFTQTVITFDQNPVCQFLYPNAFAQREPPPPLSTVLSGHKLCHSLQT